MSFIEGNFPYVNQHGLNLDWLLKTVQEHETRIKTLEDQMADVLSRLDQVEANIISLQNDMTFIFDKVSDIEYNVTNIQNDITDIRGDITNINEQIEIINNVIDNLDLDEIYNLINTYNQNSIQRDEDLARRIALLEQAVIHDIYNYIGSENLILWGSDFRKLPEQALAESGYPYGTRCSNANNTEPASGAVKYTQNGFTLDDEVSAYTYFNLGTINEVPHTSNTLEQYITVTFGVVSGATPSMGDTPTAYAFTCDKVDSNFPLTGFLNSANLRLVLNDSKIHVQIRGAASAFADLANKYITYCRVEYGNTSSGVRYNNDDAKLANAIAIASGGLTPSDVKLIVQENLEEIIDTEVYEEEYDVTLVPKDQSGTYSVPAKIDVRLQKTVGYISGMIAINIPFTEPTKYVDFTKTFEVVLDTADLDIPKKTIEADTIHAFTDLFTGAQFNAVLNNGEGTILHPSNQICSIRLWGAMKPITLDNNGQDFCTLGVIKVFEPCDWYLTPPQ